MKYVLLFVDTEEFARDLEAMGPAERDRAYLDEALRMVKTWPGCPIVEIRPLE